MTNLSVIFKLTLFKSFYCSHYLVVTFSNETPINHNNMVFVKEADQNQNCCGIRWECVSSERNGVVSRYG